MTFISPHYTSADYIITSLKRIQTMHAHAGHDKHAGHHTGDFLKRFWICLILTIPVLALSHMIQQWFGFRLKVYRR